MTASRRTVSGATATGTAGTDGAPRDVLPTVVAVPEPDLSAAGGADVLALALAGPVAGERSPQPRAGSAEVALRTGIDLAEVCEHARFTGSAGSVLRVPLPAGTHGLPAGLLLVGTGDESLTALRRAGAGLARAVRGTERVATLATAGLEPEAVLAVVEGLLLAAWTPPWTGTGQGPRPGPERVELLGCGSPAAVQRAAVGARAAWTARRLTATPSSTKSPQWLAEQARRLAAERPGVTVEVLQDADLVSRGFGGLLAVGGGSASPPRMVRLGWTPPGAGRGTRHVVLVGKGVTFDTGGLSIKPREAMLGMKTDMAGAAVALATVLAAAELGVGHRVTALLPLAENAVGGEAYRPGDVVTVHGGTTVEVANTDAEGRMLLADALAWADRELEPDVLVDVATLTGAATQGLGRRHAALFSADDALVAGLQRAGEETGERVWPMPLVEEYRAALDSEVADLRHVPSDPHVSGGAITAALFLREFAGRRRWAHLDIAGPARSDREEHELPKGATGFGARLLLRWLEQLSGC